MKNLFSFFLIVLSISASSQQDPFLTGDVLTTPIWHNPAAYGTWNKFSLNSVGRFTTPTPAYESGFFLVNSEFKFGYKKGDKMSYDLTKIQSGVGVNFYYDKVSIAESMVTSINYNVQIKFKNHARLSFGLSPGFQKVSFDSLYVPPTNVPDPNIVNGSQTKFTLGAGLMFYSKRMYLGLSSTHLFPTTYEAINFTAARHYYLNAGYKIPITRKFTIFPTLNLAADGAAFSYSAMVLFLYDKNYTAGIGYGLNNHLRFMLGYELKNFMLHYYLGYNLNPLLGNNLSHEIRFSFKIFHAPACSSCEAF